MIIVSHIENPTIAFAFHDNSQYEEIKSAYPADQYVFNGFKDLIYKSTELNEKNVEIEVEKTLEIGDDFEAIGLKPSIPESLSKRQFYTQLALMGVISQSEALAVITSGDLPAAMETYISGIPEEDKFSTRMLLAGATSFERDHPMVSTFGFLTFGANEADVDAGLDQMWIDAYDL